MKEPANKPEALPPRSLGEDSTFFKRVERLAEGLKRGRAVFHRTRRPFTRLQDVLGQIRASPNRASLALSPCRLWEAAGRSLLSPY